MTIKVKVFSKKYLLVLPIVLIIATISLSLSCGEEKKEEDNATPDTFPPTVIIHPSNNSRIGTLLPKIIASFSDDQSGMNPESLLIRINGHNCSSSFSLSTNRAEYQIDDPPLIIEGYNTIQVELSDKAGNSIITISKFYASNLVDGGGTISGTVTCKETGAAVSGLSVRGIVSEMPSWYLSSVTQTDGSYRLIGLPEGEYEVIVEVPQGINLVKETYPDLIIISANSEVEGINFELSIGGIISGKVVSAADSSPIGGVRVTGNMQEAGIPNYSYSRDDGSYTIVGLPTGDHSVSVYVPSDLNFIDESYPSPVNVVQGEEVPNINFALKAGGRILGKVTRDSDGSGVGGVTVCAYLPIIIPASQGSLRTKVSGVSLDPVVIIICLSPYDITDTDGSYEINGLETGEYRVEVKVPPNMNLIEETMLDVAVTQGGDTFGIDFALIEGGIISGTITAEDGGHPLQGIRVSARNIDTEKVKSYYKTDAQGKYKIMGLAAGTYKVFTGTSQDYVDEYYDNVTDPAEATPIPVTAGDEVPGIDFTLVGK